MAVIAAVTVFGISGCSKQGEGADTSGVQEGNASTAQTLDTSKLQTAFQTAPEVDKAQVQQAIEAVKAKNYQGALASLQKVATTANLTPEQKSAVQDLMDQIKAKGMALGKTMTGMGAAATNQAAEGASNAGQDLQKALPKQ